MKKPRVKDFDPDAKVPKLESPLDDMPAIQKPAPPRRTKTLVEPPTTSQDAEKPYGRTDVRPPVRAGVRRTITRYSFEFFQDQIENLRRFSLEEKARGEKGSMSQMIREAVDAFIAKRNRTEE